MSMCKYDECSWNLERLDFETLEFGELRPFALLLCVIEFDYVLLVRSCHCTGTSHSEL